jgi:hypothetical protein
MPRSYLVCRVYYYITLKIIEAIKTFNTNVTHQLTTFSMSITQSLGHHMHVGFLYLIFVIINAVEAEIFLPLYSSRLKFRKTSS